MKITSGTWPKNVWTINDNKTIHKLASLYRQKLACEVHHSSLENTNNRCRINLQREGIPHVNNSQKENNVLFSNDTGILGKRNSEFSQQESNLRPSVY